MAKNKTNKKRTKPKGSAVKKGKPLKKTVKKNLAKKRGTPKKKLAKKKPALKKAAEKTEALGQKTSRDGWHCQVCGSRQNLQVHHQRLRSQQGDDDDLNLITVCAECHEELHR